MANQHESNLDDANDFLAQGDIYQEMRKPQKAVILYEQALNIYEINGDHKKQLILLEKLSNSYQNILDEIKTKRDGLFRNTNSEVIEKTDSANEGGGITGSENKKITSGNEGEGITGSGKKKTTSGNEGEGITGSGGGSEDEPTDS